MSNPYKLKQPIGPGYNMDPDDVREIKTALVGTGHYKPPEFGITEIPDNQMLDAIRGYQKDNNLKVDGVMRPGGETENSIAAMGRWKSKRYKCIVCNKRIFHGGVGSKYVCSDCLSKPPYNLKPPYDDD